MTVKELRAVLATFPDDMRVVIDGYEYGVEDLEVVKQVKVHENANKGLRYCGAHDIADRDPSWYGEGAVLFDTVYLPRK